MLFRGACQEDVQQIKKLWDYCFEKQTDLFFRWYFENYFAAENVIAGFHNGQLVTCLHLNPYDIYLRETVFPASYVVGLATFPEGRRMGLINELLKASFAEMRNRGHYVSVLMPSKAGFYYPYGYELCYHHYQYRIPIEELRSVASKEGIFHPYHQDDSTELLNDIYTKFVMPLHGYAVRSKRIWKNHIDVHFREDGYIYLLEMSNRYCGYIMYRFDGEKIIIAEMAYDSWEAQQALLGFIYNHRSQARIMEWLAPVNDLLVFRLSEPKQDIRLYPFMTARIIDVVKVLEKLSYPERAAAQLTLKITDDLAEWNNVTFTLKVKACCAEIMPANGEAAAVVCSIGGLSQLVFGRLSARQLFNLHEIHGDEKGIVLLDEWFPLCDNYINEYF